MKVIGKIGDIKLTYQQEKSRQDGTKYWSEKYQIVFEVGDDYHLVDTKFIYPQSKDGGLEILKKRNGIFVGAWGEMIFKYAFRTWQNNATGEEKRIREVEMLEFRNMIPQKPKEQATEPQPVIEGAPQEDVNAAIAKAEAKVAAEQLVDGSSDLPF